MYISFISNPGDSGLSLSCKVELGRTFRRFGNCIRLKSIITCALLDQGNSCTTTMLISTAIAAACIKSPSHPAIQCCKPILQTFSAFAS